MPGNGRSLFSSPLTMRVRRRAVAGAGGTKRFYNAIGLCDGVQAPI